MSMNLTAQIARQLRDVFFGGNWTASDMKKHLTGLDWQLVTTPVQALNTIAALVYHINYYVCAVTTVLSGDQLSASDKFSFDHPIICSQQDWNALLDKSWSDVEKLASLIENLPEIKLWEDFSDGRYGNIYRNLTGVIEHVHYHLGQIVLIRKMIDPGYFD